MYNLSTINFYLGLMDRISNFIERSVSWLYQIFPGNMLHALLILIVGGFAAILITQGVRRTLRYGYLREWLDMIHLSARELIAKLVFWSVTLFVVVSAAEVLGLPFVDRFVDLVFVPIVAFLPKILSALFILLVALAVGYLLKGIVVNIMDRIDLDNEVGDEVIGVHENTLRDTLALVAFYGALLIFVPTILSQLGMSSLSSYFNESAVSLFRLIQRVFVAGLYVVVAYFASRYLGLLVRRFVNLAPARRAIDSFRSMLSVDSSVDIGDYLVRGVSAFVVYVGLKEAVLALGIDTLIRAFNTVEVYAGKILIASIIFILGALFTNFVFDNFISGAKSLDGTFKSFIKMLMLFVFATLALSEAGLGEDIALVAFAALAFTLAVSTTIALGVGGYPIARKKLEEFINR